MYLPALPNALLLLLALYTQQVRSEDNSKPVDPCTVVSSTGSFYDLRPLTIKLPADPKKPGKNEKEESWHARGFDYKSNFTLNVCAPVVEELHDDVVGIDSSSRKNISAFYQAGSKTYSLGQASTNVTLRGRRLVLQYINGSPCGPEAKKKETSDAKWLDDDKDEENPKYRQNANAPEGSQRKSATISFHCDKDPLATAAVATFVGVDPDECAYAFEILSRDACIGAEPAKGGAGPTTVFVIIGIIAILVYFIGGVFYQRNVSNARGWRQLPNYSMWSGMVNFIKDIFIASTSSCAQLMPRRRGYSAVSTNGFSSRRRGEEENNALIDSLDEEWND